MKDNVFMWKTSILVMFSGKDIVAVDSPIGRLGLSVCYDLRFPELYQLLRFQHGAQVLNGKFSFLFRIGCLESKILLCFTISRYYWCLQRSLKWVVKHIGRFFFVLVQLRVSAMYAFSFSSSDTSPLPLFPYFCHPQLTYV